MLTLSLFDIWNKKKKAIHEKNTVRYFQERDIVWTKMGMNIGDEENGKGEEFMRPVLVIKKFNNNLFWGIPPSSKRKQNNPYYFSFVLEGVERFAIISQIRLFDAKRLESKIGKISVQDFDLIKKASIFIILSI